MPLTDTALENRDYLTFSRWLSGLLRKGRLIAGITIGAMLLVIAATFIIPPVYRSRASFVANASSASKISSGLGATSAFGGILSGLGGSLGSDPSESPQFYLSLLGSRELQTRLLLSRFPNPRTAAPNDSATLLSILKLKGSNARQLEIGAKLMNKAVNAGMDPRTNFVWFTVDAQWAELSAQIANRLISLVSDFNRETRVSRAKSKRLFLQMRYDSAQNALRNIEEYEKGFREQNRGAITAPELQFQLNRIKREADLASNLYITLASQLEAARIDEINDAALITVIDSAVVPRKAQWPRYGASLMASMFFGFLFGLLFAGSVTVIEDWARRNPEEWNELAARFRRGRRNNASAAGAEPIRLEDTTKTTRLSTR
jgi:uncharacterized protein involved in exopolysaccharide biosynthesis